MAIVFKDLPDEELIYGQKSCQGCGALLAGRLKAVEAYLNTSNSDYVDKNVLAAMLGI